MVHALGNIPAFRCLSTADVSLLNLLYRNSFSEGTYVFSLHVVFFVDPELSDCCMYFYTYVQ